jgi:methionyl-tRNA formyltransferase
MDLSLRIVFMGTPSFAVPSLRAIIDAGFNVPLVVTMPDKPRGRGGIKALTPVKEFALSLGIEVSEPHVLKDPAFMEKVRSIGPDFIAVVAYGKILPKAVLKIPRLGAVNLHASLLPCYRGAAPINWAIINGDDITGVSTMLMDEGMDTGPVLLEEKVSIADDETSEGLSKRLSMLGASLLVKTLELLGKGAIVPRAQDDSCATYARPLKKGDGLIDWSRDSIAIANLARGVCPWPGAFTHWNGRLVKIHRGWPAENAYDEGGPPGTVVGLGSGAIAVRCGRGVFLITELQMEGKKRLGAGDFMKGYKLKKGDRFV